MGALLDAFSVSRRIDEGAVAQLAGVLAASGETFPTDGSATDIASTGGPSSLSTLLCPLQLRVRGRRVIKLAVPGRPAGGVDVLATIPGYDAALPLRDALAVARHAGYVHLIANTTWTPLDRELFRYRQQHRGQAVPGLVVASLLSKKIASGLLKFGVEIRLAPFGSLGADEVAARRNAKLLIRVGQQLGLTATCFLTDGTRPFQPFVGRGEALVALAQIFDERASDWLAEHASMCDSMSMRVAGGRPAPPTADELRQTFESNLAAQGATAAGFRDRVAAVETSRHVECSAPSAGVVEWDLGMLRRALVSRQTAAARKASIDEFPDPAGCELLADTGALVTAGAPLLRVRAETERSARALGDEILARAVRITDTEHEPLVRRQPEMIAVA